MHSRKPSDDADKNKKPRKARAKKGETTPAKKASAPPPPPPPREHYEREMAGLRARVEGASAGRAA